MRWRFRPAARRAVMAPTPGMIRMRWDHLLMLLGWLQPMLLVVLVPRRWVGRAMAIWVALPVPVFVAVVLHEAATRPGTTMSGDTLAMAFGLMLTTFGAAWVVASGVAFLIGLGLRRLLRPGDKAAAQVEALSRAPRAPLRPAPLPPAPLPPPGVLPNDTATQTRDSADGRLRARIASVEWANGHWVHAPRIEERATGRVLLDLWGTDWDADLGFDTPGQVWLGLRRYRGPGAWTLVLDLDAGTATLTGADRAAPAPPVTFPLAEAGARLEAASAWMRAALQPEAAPPPGRFAAWRTALLILVLACGAIAGLTWLSLPAKPPTQVLDKLPEFPRR